MAVRRTISGFSNPTVKFVRSLRDKKHRRREGKFLAEGLRLLTDARESGRLPEMLVMASEREPHPLLAALEAEVERTGGEIVETSAEILAKITGKEGLEFDGPARVFDCEEDMLRALSMARLSVAKGEGWISTAWSNPSVPSTAQCVSGGASGSA